MVRTRYKPNSLYKLLSVLLCSALLLNSIALPPVLYAQSTANDQDGKPAVYLPLIQSSPTAALSDKATETATVSAANTTLPTPSGAKPPYPLNHQLDGLFAIAGTPPSNYDFETAGSYVGTPPTNADLSAAVTAVGTPPTNHDFATGDLTGWTTSGTVTIQSDAIYSNYARLQSSAVLVSDAFTVDSAAQQIAFAIGYFSSAAINLYVLSGAGYSTRTKIDYLYCNTCGWTTYTLDAAAYSGQSIKLEFNRAGGTLGIDNLQMRILLPGYTAVQNPIARVEQSNGNVYARLGYMGLLTSAAFTVETSAQVATVDVSGLTTASDQYRIDVLSGPTFVTVTQVAGNTNAPGSWQRVQLNLVAWQGQSIQLRVTGLLRTIGVDNIGGQGISLPGWQFTGNATVGDDGDGNRTVITDTIGRTEHFTYDALNRPAGYTNKAGRQTTYVYDAASQLREIREPSQTITRVTTFDYNARGLLKTVTNALNEPPTTYFYDNGGRVHEIRDPDGKGVIYGYDPVTGLQASMTDRVGKTTYYAYDPAGNMTAVTDPVGRTTSFAYDELNRLHLATAPNSTPMRYEYYPTGKLKELWSPAQRPTYYAYEGRGLVTSITDAFGRALTYTYDEVGRLKTATDRRQTDPYVLEYVYDEGGRLTDMRGAASFTNVGVHYAYDGANRLQAVTDPNGLTTSYTYNALDQVQTATQPISRTYTYSMMSMIGCGRPQIRAGSKSPIPMTRLTGSNR